jgi:anti-anti-sigma factor
MRIKIEPYADKDGFYKVIPHGSIDFTTYQEFDKKVKPLVVPPLKGLIIDLADVDYISSSGLGSLLSIKKAIIKINGQLIFCNLKPQIKKLFEVLKSLPTENVFENIEEADNYLYRMINEKMNKTGE